LELIVIVLRLGWAATWLIAVALVVGAFAVAGYQQLYWYRHGIWPDLRLVHLWHWTGIDPSVANRFGAQRISQWPLWLCLIGPGIVVGWLAAKLGRWRRRDEARRAAAPPRRDAA